MFPGVLQFLGPLPTDTASTTGLTRIRGFSSGTEEASSLGIPSEEASSVLELKPRILVSPVVEAVSVGSGPKNWSTPGNIGGSGPSCDYGWRHGRRCRVKNCSHA